LDISDAHVYLDVKRAQTSGWIEKLDPCRRLERFGIHKAVLDTTAGFVYAYKSCAWAQYLARKHGVKFILDPIRGRVGKIGTSDGKPIVETIDGVKHSVDLVVVAGSRSYLTFKKHITHTNIICRWWVDAFITPRKPEPFRDYRGFSSYNPDPKEPDRLVGSVFPRKVPSHNMGNERRKGCVFLPKRREWRHQDRLAQN
jgi:hypothetical protein